MNAPSVGGDEREWVVVQERAGANVAKYERWWVGFALHVRLLPALFRPPRLWWCVFQVRKFFAIYNTSLEIEAEHAPNVTRDVEAAVLLREVRESSGVAHSNPDS